MSEELQLEAAPAKPNKKAAAAKKSPAKKAGAKKVAGRKTTPQVAEAILRHDAVTEITPPATNGTKKSKLPRKSPVLKKAAEILALMSRQTEAAAEEVALPMHEVEMANAAEKYEAPVAEPVSEPVMADAPVADDMAEPGRDIPAPEDEAVTRSSLAPEIRGETPLPERRKTKFERWKERRERFRQEKLARQQAGGGTVVTQSNGQHGQPRHSDAQANGDDDHSRMPDVQLGPPEPADGILEMTPKGYGFLRQRDRAYAQHPNDAFIAPEFIRQYGLREGMQVIGIAQKGQRGPQITSVNEVNGRAPEAMRDMPLFEELKAINPNKKIQFETTKDRMTTRVIDMFTPVGRGQRGLIVAPPRAGKTTLLQHIAEALVLNHPTIHLMILLVDERPEEVTEFKRILPKAEIYASSNDQDVKSHTRIAAFAVERAKRLVECGEHVFMLMDSITRLARAYNNAKQGGATMSGGMGVGAMEIPRRLFAAARNTRTAGSLTVLATALIETGSRMDDLIFQEFKGTGNMELVLDRKIAEQFYYPAVNIFKSGTRREELLLQPFQLDKIHMLRRGLAGHKPIDAIQRVLQLMERYPSNAQMLVDLPSKG